MKGLSFLFGIAAGIILCKYFSNQNLKFKNFKEINALKDDFEEYIYN